MLKPTCKSAKKWYWIENSRNEMLLKLAYNDPKCCDSDILNESTLTQNAIECYNLNESSMTQNTVESHILMPKNAVKSNILKWVFSPSPKCSWIEQSKWVFSDPV